MLVASPDRPATLAGAALSVARTDITFADVAPGRVRVEVTVWNLGDGWSAPTTAFLSSAPLGAFVPWRPLAVLPVPALPPGGDAVLRFDALRPEVAPLGPPDRVPPRKLLTALGAEDDRPGAAGPRPGVLAADLADLLGRSNVYWAGNLNVFVGGRAVERHMAQALRVYPGRTNLAMFVLGSGPDAYRFHLGGNAAGWDARLHDMTDAGAWSLDLAGDPIAAGDWLESRRQRMLMLALQPPTGCGPGSVEVHVEQRSSGQTAVVEFSLDPSAAGPGCYVV
jgi:hypothetical protein